MFVVILTYKKPLTEIEAYIKVHRDFLDEGYKENYFVTSGPQNPRTGGVIISQLNDREQLENILHQDPFYTNELADYEIIEFTPIKYHKDFESFLN